MGLFKSMLTNFTNTKFLCPLNKIIILNTDMPTAERWTAVSPEVTEGNHEKSTVNILG